MRIEFLPSLHGDQCSSPEGLKATGRDPAERAGRGREGADGTAEKGVFATGKQTLSRAGVGSRPREQEARSCGGPGAWVIRPEAREASAGSPSGWRD